MFIPTEIYLLILSHFKNNILNTIPFDLISVFRIEIYRDHSLILKSQG